MTTGRSLESATNGTMDIWLQVKQYSLYTIPRNLTRLVVGLCSSGRGAIRGISAIKLIRVRKCKIGNYLYVASGKGTAEVSQERNLW